MCGGVLLYGTKKKKREGAVPLAVKPPKLLEFLITADGGRTGEGKKAHPTCLFSLQTSKRMRFPRDDGQGEQSSMRQETAGFMGNLVHGGKNEQWCERKVISSN